MVQGVEGLGRKQRRREAEQSCEFTTPTCARTGRGSVGYGSADYGSGG